MATEGTGNCFYFFGVGQGSGPGGNLFLVSETIFACFTYLLVILVDNDAQGYLYFTIENINDAILIDLIMTLLH